MPGVVLLAIVGYGGKLIEQSVAVYSKTHHLTVPNIEYVLWAILIGLVISNTVGVAEIFRSGIATYEFWLKAGIVLLGSRFLLGDVLRLGGISLALAPTTIRRNTAIRLEESSHSRRAREPMSFTAASSSSPETRPSTPGISSRPQPLH